jgi:hypothetical protein
MYLRRQTGGPGFVVSNGAVFDADVHGSEERVGEMAGIRREESETVIGQLICY